MVYFALCKKKNLCSEQFFQHNLIQLFLKIAHWGKENKNYFNQEIKITVMEQTNVYGKYGIIFYIQTWFQGIKRLAGR